MPSGIVPVRLFPLTSLYIWKATNVNKIKLQLMHQDMQWSRAVNLQVPQASQLAHIRWQSSGQWVTPQASEDQDNRNVITWKHLLQWAKQNDVELLQVLQYFIPVDEPGDVAGKLVLCQIPITKGQTNISLPRQHNKWQTKYRKGNSFGVRAKAQKSRWHKRNKNHQMCPAITKEVKESRIEKGPRKLTRSWDLESGTMWKGWVPWVGCSSKSCQESRGKCHKTSNPKALERVGSN